MPGPYSLDTKLEARRMWVEDGMGATAISRQMGGKPTAQTILNWSGVADSEGMTWDDHRQARVELMINAATPEHMATKLMGRISRLLDDPDLDVKHADALAKYAKVFKQLIDPAYQVSMTYQVLTGWIEFCRESYPDLLTEEMIGATRDYKTTARRRLGL